jgi:hypothetical protein
MFPSATYPDVSTTASILIGDTNRVLELDDHGAGHDGNEVCFIIQSKQRITHQMNRCAI